MAVVSGKQCGAVPVGVVEEVVDVRVSLRVAVDDVQATGGDRGTEQELLGLLALSEAQAIT